MAKSNGKLSRGEKLVIFRRRKGWTMAQAAKRMKTDRLTYKAWEADEESGPNMSIGKVELHELCYLHRRRRGKTLAEVAESMDVCRWWLRQMERGTAPVDPLAKHWRLGARG